MVKWKSYVNIFFDPVNVDRITRDFKTTSCQFTFCLLEIKKYCDHVESCEEKRNISTVIINLYMNVRQILFHITKGWVVLDITGTNEVSRTVGS